MSVLNFKNLKKAMENHRNVMVIHRKQKKNRNFGELSASETCKNTGWKCMELAC